MSRPRHALLALCIVLFGSLAGAGAHAQADNPDKWTLQPLLPPNFPALPPNSQLNPGTASSPTPYTSGPLQNPTQSPTQPAPGLRLSIPSR